MINEKTAFLLGRGYVGVKRPYLWDPDQMSNGHTVIWGGSGSGKTTILREIVSYLQGRNKHIHLLDLHGTLRTEGANNMVFGTWDSEYGVNPFEFLREYNAGPEQQANVIIGMFKKTYMSSMGPLQEAVLRKLIIDTYSQAGIKPRDMDTWGPEDNSKLPNMEDMLSLINNIMSSTGLSEEEEIGKGIHDIGKKIGKQANEVRSLRDQMLELDESEDISQDRINKAAEELHKAEQKLETLRNEASEMITRYIEDRFVLQVPIKKAQGLNIDYGYYASKEAEGVLKKIKLYLESLIRQGVFKSTPPPVKPGLNVYDLNSLDERGKNFFVDALVAKIFRALRNRGEYHKLERRPRGDKLDTYIIIDECQSVLPSKKADRDLQDLMLNRIMAEARKYGLGLILITQSPQNFSSIILANAAQKIGFNTHASDIPSAKKLLGIKQDFLFEHAKMPGIAIISTSDGFVSVDTENPILLKEREKFMANRRGGGAPALGESGVNQGEKPQLHAVPGGKEEEKPPKPSVTPSFG